MSIVHWAYASRHFMTFLWFPRPLYFFVPIQRRPYFVGSWDFEGTQIPPIQLPFLDNVPWISQLELHWLKRGLRAQTFRTPSPSKFGPLRCIGQVWFGRKPHSFGRSPRRSEGLWSKAGMTCREWSCVTFYFPYGHLVGQIPFRGSFESTFSRFLMQIRVHFGRSTWL